MTNERRELPVQLLETDVLIAGQALDVLGEGDGAPELGQEDGDQGTLVTPGVGPGV